MLKYWAQHAYYLDSDFAEIGDIREKAGITVELGRSAKERLLPGLYTRIEVQEVALQNKTVTLKLNQQQLELLDRTVIHGIAPDRASLIRLALRELAAKRGVGGARQ
jgi:hypothetical protein